MIQFLSHLSFAAIFISTIEDLQKIGQPGYPLNGEYVLIQDIDASATSGWNGGAGFVPIGTRTSRFTGRLHGNRHKILNLYINRPNQDDVGLFGATGTGARIDNFGIINANVTGQNYVGILIGYNDRAVLINCYTTGSVSGNQYVGGLAGESRGAGGSAELCYSFATVSGSSYVGGLIGGNRIVLTKCYVGGTVSGSSYAGGLLGENRADLNNCYSVSSVSGGSYIGGLVASNRATVSNCYSAGSVSATSGSAGGLIADNTSQVIDSYWDTETSGQTSSSGGIGKTTAEMKQQTTFVNWDFVNIWSIEENVTYPYLKWEIAAVVPYVFGMTQTLAESEIISSNLIVGTITSQCSNTVPAGRIITQFPNWGERVPVGSPVNLVISTGPCDAVVPSIVGMEQSSTDMAIIKSRLVVGTVNQQCSNTEPAGIVMNQSLTEGTSVLWGTAVDIVLSSGSYQ